MLTRKAPAPTRPWVGSGSPGLQILRTNSTLFICGASARAIFSPHAGHTKIPPLGGENPGPRAHVVEHEPQLTLGHGSLTGPDREEALILSVG